MYIAMNHFRISPDKGPEFEQVWRDRESFLAGTPGFQSFHLLRGPVEDGAALYASHTVWADEQTFVDWTNSEAFRKAHAQGRTSGMLLGPPKFVGWTAVL